MTKSQHGRENFSGTRIGRKEFNMSREGRFYKVAQGECLSSIAAREGFIWETIWEHSNNSELKRRLQDPNILKPGDTLWIPPKTLKKVNRPTEAEHRFVKRGVPTVLRLRLLDNDRPRSSLEYLLNVDGHHIRGVTDADGRIEHRIPPTARHGELKLLGTDGAVVETYQLQLGHLNPTNDLTGVQQRLRNLGFRCELTGEWDEQTKSAVAEFRQKNNLPESDELDDETRRRLKEDHGS